MGPIVEDAGTSTTLLPIQSIECTPSRQKGDALRVTKSVIGLQIGFMEHGYDRLHQSRALIIRDDCLRLLWAMCGPCERVA